MQALKNSFEGIRHEHRTRVSLQISPAVYARARQHIALRVQNQLLSVRMDIPAAIENEIDSPQQEKNDG